MRLQSPTRLTDPPRLSDDNIDLMFDLWFFLKAGEVLSIQPDLNTKPTETKPQKLKQHDWLDKYGVIEKKLSKKLTTHELTYEDCIAISQALGFEDINQFAEEVLKFTITPEGTYEHSPLNDLTRRLDRCIQFTRKCDLESDSNHEHSREQYFLRSVQQTLQYTNDTKSSICKFSIPCYGTFGLSNLNTDGKKLLGLAKTRLKAADATAKAAAKTTNSAKAGGCCAALLSLCYRPKFFYRGSVPRQAQQVAPSDSEPEVINNPMWMRK